MPLVKISIRKNYSKEEKIKINEIIHSSLIESFKIPDHDYNHRIDEFDDANFHIPDGKSDRYMIIEMTIFPGRSIDAKRKLYNLIVTKLEELKLNKTDVLIVLNEPEINNWGILGKLGSEIDLGFSTKV